ncbi:MAG: histidine kinase [Bacteroidetes bacterium]|nr:histidine kinase [Bacteroidota bacterium]
MNFFLGKHRTLLLHLSFWVLYTTYRFYDISEFTGWQLGIAYVGIPLIFNLVASYGHYFLLLPVWLSRKQVWRYLFLTLLLIGFVSTIRILVENEIYPSFSKNVDYFKTVKLSRVISTIWDALGFMLFTGMIRFTVDRFDLESKQKQLQNEKLAAELNFLKAQINPHFLFNTLHNLNYLVYAKSDNATDVIIKLSNIMRYMIYDASKLSVPLTKELDYLHDYIHLESIRLTNGFDLQFDKHGDYHHVEIAPLLMITLLENAFKHGVRDKDKNSWIKMKLRVNDQTIYYEVSNQILATDPTKLRSGFGLDNLRKRLELSYPDRHRLEILQDADIYTVRLTLYRK